MATASQECKFVVSRPSLVYDGQNMPKGKTTLVTGCSGLLGPWLCEVLIDAGAKVVGLDKEFPSSSRIHDLSKRMQVVQGNVQDSKHLAELLREHDIAFVYHLAAQALVGVAAKDPVGTFEDNVSGTWTVLEAVRQRRDKDGKKVGVLFASSDKAYGDQPNLPYLEDCSLIGRYPYDVSKSCADLIAQSYFHSYRLPVCIARCGNLFGAGDLNFSRIVPGTIRSLLRGERPIIRSDGSPVRDYIYVEDAARAYLEISSAMLASDQFNGESFNISNDQPVSVLKIVEILSELMGRSDLTPIIENTATLEIQAQYLNSKKIRQTIGWQPKYTLPEGLKQTIEWYRNHPKLRNHCENLVAG
jgi:CDP-glucose 4,6-dehydratase